MPEQISARGLVLLADEEDDAIMKVRASVDYVSIGS